MKDGKVQVCGQINRTEGPVLASPLSQLVLTIQIILIFKFAAKHS